MLLRKCLHPTILVIVILSVTVITLLHHCYKLEEKVAVLRRQLGSMTLTHAKEKSLLQLRIGELSSQIALDKLQRDDANFNLTRYDRELARVTWELDNARIEMRQANLAKISLSYRNRQLEQRLAILEGGILPLGPRAVDCLYSWQ